jgi:hypothetical protein
LRILDRILEIIPDDMDTLAPEAAFAQAEGDLPRAAMLLAPLQPPEGDSNVILYPSLPNIPGAPAWTKYSSAGKDVAHHDPSRGYDMGELRFWLGWAQEVAGQHADALETWRTGRAELEPLLKEQPANYTLLNELALTETGLSNKARALDLAQKAIAVMPIESRHRHNP